MSADPTGQILACHSKNKFVELFQFFKNEEAEAKLKKRMKKLRKKQKYVDNVPFLNVFEHIYVVNI